MKTIWKKIKGFPNHRVSNKGQIKNIKLKRLLTPNKVNKFSKLLYIYLEHNGRRKLFPIHRLVAQTFGKMKRGQDSAIHLNYIQFDNREPNLEGATRGQAMSRTRKYNRLKKNKLKGIYKWSFGNKKWRAVLSLGDAKMGTKTLGYFKTRKDAKKAYYNAYVEHFNEIPFRV